MRLDIPHIFLSDSPVIGGDFREPFNLRPLNRDSGGSGDLSAGPGHRDNRNLPLIDLRTDEGRAADELPPVEVRETPPMLFQQTGTQHTMITDDGTLVRFTDNSQFHDPSTEQHGEIKIETPFFSGPDGSGGGYFRIEQRPTQAFETLTDDSPDTRIVMGGHGLEAIAAGIYGLFAPDLGEDLSLRIAGRVGVENQRPLDRRDAARIVYEQTVVTLEGMISAGFGDLEVGARIQSEGNMTLVQLLASVKDGSSGVRLETTFNDDGSISPSPS